MADRRPSPVAFLDSSVLVASLDPDEQQHAACARLVAARSHGIYTHALAEVFAALTGGRLGRRVPPAAAARLVQDSVLPYVKVVALSTQETLSAMLACEARGVRGGAVYDWLHLAAARKAGAESFCTLNLRDFQAITRPGDPLVRGPN